MVLVAAARPGPTSEARTSRRPRRRHAAGHRLAPRFDQTPELAPRVRTSKIVAEQLREMGIEVQTGIAHTGVVGILRGGKPGPTIALRADMDALPVTEQVDVPFKSRRRPNTAARSRRHPCMLPRRAHG